MNPQENHWSAFCHYVCDSICLEFIKIVFYHMHSFVSLFHQYDVLKVIRVVAYISGFLFTAGHYCVVRTYHILSTYQSGNCWIISSLGLLWIKLLWTIMFKSWCGQMFLFTFGKYIKWSCWVKWFFFFFFSLQDLSFLNRDWTWATEVKVLNANHWTTEEFSGNCTF